MTDLPYKLATSHEKHGTSSVGVQIHVSLDRPLTDTERSELSALCDQSLRVIELQSSRLDPERQSQRAEMVAMIKGLFPGLVFAKEIPNGYCGEPCCEHRPWLLVTTRIGVIKIGWRKRVLSIDWSGSIVEQWAIDLFSAEDVTKEGLIHAWGYDKAREYIAKLHEQVSETTP